MFLNKELNLVIVVFGVACSHVFGQPQVHDEETQVCNNSTDTNQTAPVLHLSCGGKLSKTSNNVELYDAFLPQILSEKDSETDVLVKKDFLKYLTLSEPFLDMVRCKILEPSPGGVPHHQKKKLQEDEDDDGDSGGTSRIPSNQFTDALDIIANGMGNRDPLDNSNVLIGVRRILQNVFSGNIVGVVNESVGLRSPEGVQNTFVDVLSTIFGSMATAGATGIIGNSTGTANSQKEKASTEPNVYNLQGEEEEGILVEAPAVPSQHQPTLWNQQQQRQVGGLAGAVQGGSFGGGGAGGAVAGGSQQQQLLLQQQQQLIRQQQEQLEYIRTQQQIQKLQQAIQQAQGGLGGGVANPGRGDAVVAAHRPQHVQVHQPQFPRKPIQPEFNRKPIQPVHFPQHPARPQNIPLPPQQLRQGSIGS